jgi:hypothetical protein
MACSGRAASALPKVQHLSAPLKPTVGLLSDIGRRLKMKGAIFLLPILLSLPDYVRGYEPPIVTRAMKYLGLVAAYGLTGLVLVWGMKQKGSQFFPPRNPTKPCS